MYELFNRSKIKNTKMMSHLQNKQKTETKPVYFQHKEPINNIG